MLKLIYNGAGAAYDVLFLAAGNVIQVSGNNLPVNNTGFKIYRADDLLLGDYSAYTTVYRQLEGGIQYSDDGSVYVEPEPIPEPDPEPIPEPEPPTLDELQAAKRREVSAECERIIYRGITVTLADGTTEHYSLTEHDQLNLFGKQIQVSAGQAQIEYHADGQPCKYYTAADMQTIIQAAMWHVSYHTTYCNAINMWIADCGAAGDLQGIFYGADVPGEYQSDVLQAYLAEIAALAGGDNDVPDPA